MINKTLLLIAINSRFSHPNPALYYLRNSIADLGYDIIIRDFTIQSSPDEITRYIIEESPVVCAFSVYIWNTNIVRGVLDRLVQTTNVTVVLGGPEVSFNPEDWHAEYPAVDYIVTGHGEEGFRRLAIGGFSSKDKTIYSENPHFSKIPFPFRDDDFPGFQNRNIYYESSRGCPFRCAYCLSSRSDQALQFRDLSSVMEELEILIRNRPRLIKFIDRTFNADRIRARAVWRFLIDRHSGSGTAFHFEVHPALLDDDDLLLLSGAPPGLFEFEIGIQSTHDRVLESIGRKGNWDRVSERIACLIGGGNIRTHMDLIAGLPYEDLTGLAESFNRVYGVGADHFQLGTLKILPGTEMRDRAAMLGMRFGDDPPYEVTENKWLTRDDMALVKKIARLLGGLYNSGRFRTTLSELLTRFDSAWSMYEALAGKYHETDDTSWERMHGLVLELAGEHVPGEADYFQDCLAWDWFSSFDTHRVPAFIKNNETHRARSWVHFLAEKGGIALPAAVNQESLGRGRVFSPQTFRFRDVHMKGKSIAVFIEVEQDPVLL